MISDFETHQPDIHPDAFVHEMAYVSGKTNLGADTNVWPMAVLRGDVNTIKIGERTNVQDGAVLHTSHDSEYSKPGGSPLVIGDDVTIGHNATVHGCTVGDRCLIGMGSIVLDGAVIESDTMIGAGALVPPGKTLEGGYLWVGSPVKQARALNDKERAFILHSAEHYVEIAKRNAAS
jgi:carbonic anhydrase/acetyltransferase-like protein (isoleucine patch superfamily)